MQSGHDYHGCISPRAGGYLAHLRLVDSFTTVLLTCLFQVAWCLVTVLSTSVGKTFFAWRFILNENIFRPYIIRNHLSFLFLCFVLKYVP